MTIEYLAAIIEKADKKAIVKQLRTLGYIDCKKDKRLRNLDIGTLFKGKLKETDLFPDAKNKRSYQGGIFTQVKGYEQLEFVIVNINDNTNIFPIDMVILTKETANEKLQLRQLRLLRSYEQLFYPLVQLLEQSDVFNKRLLTRHNRIGL